MLTSNVQTMTSDLTSRDTTIASVPFEIWHYISKFLLDSHLRQLYPVNRAFFRIAMALRYRTVSLSGGGQLRKYFDSVSYSRILESPSLVEYVRSLIFLVDCCGIIPEYRYRQAVVLATSGPLALLPEARTFMTSLQHITDLKIMWINCYPHKLHCDACLDLLSLGWPTFSSTIHSLSLTINVDSIPSLFAIHLHFPQLEQLNLDIRAAEANTDSPVYSTLMPFIHLHANTVRALGVRLFPEANYAKFYASLGHFPNLHKFKFEYRDFGQGDGRAGALAEFLDLHSDTLTQIYWLQRSKNLDLFDVRLPRLTNLRVAFIPQQIPQMWGNLDQVVQPLHRYTQPLASLSILSNTLLFFEVPHLLDVKALSRLRNLELSLMCLDYSTFSTIATALPNLERFVARFDSLSLNHEEFSAGDNLGSWGITELVLDYTGERTLLGLRNWIQFLLEIFPRVEYLNGRYREEFLDGSTTRLVN